MKLVIINYGAGNIQSIMFAIERLGYKAVLSNDPAEIKAADKVIFPGVGEASSAMKMLLASGLDALIPTLTQPVLGICLGMQLMCNKTEEGNTKGLDTKIVINPLIIELSKKFFFLLDMFMVSSIFFYFSHNCESFKSYAFF